MTRLEPETTFLLRLCDAATAAGDLETAALADRALAGDLGALTACARSSERNRRFWLTFWSDARLMYSKMEVRFRAEGRFDEASQVNASTLRFEHRLAQGER